MKIKQLYGTHNLWHKRRGAYPVSAHRHTHEKGKMCLAYTHNMCLKKKPKTMDTTEQEERIKCSHSMGFVRCMSACNICCSTQPDMMVYYYKHRCICSPAKHLRRVLAGSALWSHDVYQKLLHHAWGIRLKHAAIGRDDLRLRSELREL